MISFSAKASTSTGFQASGSGVPVPTQKVATATPVTVGSRSPSLLLSPLLASVKLSSARGSMAPAASYQAIPPAAPLAPEPARADLLKRYGLIAAVGLVAAVVLYKIVKK